MFLAMVGAISAQAFLARVHDREIATLETLPKNSPGNNTHGNTEDNAADKGERSVPTVIFRSRNFLANTRVKASTAALGAALNCVDQAFEGFQFFKSHRCYGSTT
jgi:hypothetical protein